MKIFGNDEAPKLVFSEQELSELEPEQVKLDAPHPLLWLDIETTGLDPREDQIFEVAMVKTDDDLNVLEELQIVLGDTLEWVTLGKVKPEVLKMHVDNGLLLEARASSVRSEEAKWKIIKFLTDDYSQSGSFWEPVKKYTLAGSSVHFDKSFVLAKWPGLASYFDYRIVDVSTLRELGKRWLPAYSLPEWDESEHRALSDIHRSIEILRFWRGELYG